MDFFIVVERNGPGFDPLISNTRKQAAYNQGWSNVIAFIPLLA